MPPKRKVSASVGDGISDGLKHPPTKVAKQIDGDLPYDKTKTALDRQTEPKHVDGNVAHWFRSKDLRIHDNKALYAASEFAKKEGRPLIGFYVYCAAEFEWHGTSPARCDFILENLKLMQRELEKLGIPFVIVVAEGRKDLVPAVVRFVAENKIERLLANWEYEVDELRRDAKFLKEIGSKTYFELHHDQTVMEPGSIQSGSGKPMKIFTPYHKMWLGIVKDDPTLLDIVPAPQKVAESDSKHVKHLFGSRIPTAPENKTFSSTTDRDRIRKMWPAGHEAGMARMDGFLKKKVAKYAATRSDPSKDSSSRMSPYFSAGVVSVREALSKCMAYNDGSADFTINGAGDGMSAWVREIVFRELYRQSILYTPHTVMNLPNNLKFTLVKWEKDEEGWKKWCEGTTGVPLVDAGMRQLKHEAWMHNRARMNVSSYLYCNLLIDHRRGERFFAENLIDWDLANNTQGWEPSYTVFNPTSQAERNDPEGDYIRRWVPELRDVQGKAVFAPHARMEKKAFQKLGYPMPHVDWDETKKRCLDVFKRDMGGKTI